MNAKLIRFLIVTLILVNNTTAQHGNRKSEPSPITQRNLPSINRQQWYTFNSPDKDFIVEFPTKPRRDADSEVPAGTMRNYVLDTDSISFQLAYVDVGVEPTSREGNELPLSFRRSMLDQASERGWVVLRSYSEFTADALVAGAMLKLYILSNICAATASDKTLYVL